MGGWGGLDQVSGSSGIAILLQENYGEKKRGGGEVGGSTCKESIKTLRRSIDRRRELMRVRDRGRDRGRQERTTNIHIFFFCNSLVL